METVSSLAGFGTLVLREGVRKEGNEEAPAQAAVTHGHSVGGG